MSDRLSTQESEGALPAGFAHDKHHSFWKLWSASGFSNLGDGIYQVVLPLLVVQITTSPARVAGVSMMLSLPWLVFALQAGSIVDRFNHRMILLWVSTGRFLLLSILTLAVLTGSISIGFLYVAALLLGIGETLVDTALASIIPSIVPKEKLQWANSRLTASQTVTNTFVGPPLAGFLAGLSFALATAASMGMYLLTTVALFWMPPMGERIRRQGDPHWLRHLTEGLRFLWNHRLLRSLTLFTAAMNFFWAGWSALLVLYAVKPGPMGLDEFGYSLLLTAMAVGGLLGSALCERVEKFLGVQKTLALDFLGTIALLGVPALTTSALAVSSATFLAGFGAALWVILVASIRQRQVPAGLLGRVYSGSRFISWGIGPIGAAVAGIFASIWGIRDLFAIGGIISFGLLVLFLIAVPARLLQSEAA